MYSDNPKISELATPKALRRMAHEWHAAGFPNLANRLRNEADVLEDALADSTWALQHGGR
jgi:protein-disulfide isomerase-like protein with CxxC motif